jgi:hypothetical protein
MRFASFGRCFVFVARFLTFSLKATFLSWLESVEDASRMAMHKQFFSILCESMQKTRTPHHWRTLTVSVVDNIVFAVHDEQNALPVEEKELKLSFAETLHFVLTKQRLFSVNAWMESRLTTGLSLSAVVLLDNLITSEPFRLQDVNLCDLSIFAAANQQQKAGVWPLLRKRKWLLSMLCLAAVGLVVAIPTRSSLIKQLESECNILKVRNEGLLKWASEEQGQRNLLNRALEEQSDRIYQLQNRIKSMEWTRNILENRVQVLSLEKQNLEEKLRAATEKLREEFSARDMSFTKLSKLLRIDSLKNLSWKDVTKTLETKAKELLDMLPNMKSSKCSCEGEKLKMQVIVSDYDACVNELFRCKSNQQRK